VPNETIETMQQPKMQESLLVFAQVSQAERTRLLVPMPLQLNPFYQND